MPAGLIPDEGLSITLQELLGVIPPSVLPWQLRLWTGDLVPDHTVVLADLEECTFAGYARAYLPKDQWSAPTVADGCAHSTNGADPIVWTVTGGPEQSVSGYAYVDAGWNIIRFIQRFDAEDIVPIQIPGTLTLHPDYTLTSAECA